MIKALFFDLDGTLLTSEKTIAPLTRAALRASREQGLGVYIATGRSPRLDKTLCWTAEEVALFDGGVYSNGACVVLDGKAQWARIAPTAVQTCVRLAGEYGVHLSLHMDDGAHAFNFDLPRSVWGPWGVDEGNTVPLDAAAIRRTVKMLIFHEHLVDSVTLLPPGLLDALTAAVGDRVSLYLTDQGRTIQMAAKDVSKLTGIERICAAKGLSPEEIAVFGDDLNDLPMLRRYPNSVAMGNAMPEVKQAAAHVTATNDEDGIAQALCPLLKL